MVDFTKIKEPFGLLDEIYGKGTREALKAHGGPYQCFVGKWADTEKPTWSDIAAYRVKPVEYKPGKLYEWHGGWPPVDDDTIVSVVLRRGKVNRPTPAKFLAWGHSNSNCDIIAFVVEDI